MYNPNLHFHFVGIGGTGMSGIAEILLNSGFKVSGSDLKMSPVVSRLVELGAEVQLGHTAEHLPEDASLLVYSSAVSLNNPELEEARKRDIPIVRRAEVLAELMRLKYGVAVAGSHGKTTTTSLLSAILEAAKFDPTVIIGGQVKSHGSGGKLGKSDFLIAESDESDRSFLLLKPTIAVITNIDEEHMEAYESLEDLEDSFEEFANAVPFYGLAVFCIDDEKTARIANEYKRRKITYGFTQAADLRAANIRHSWGKTSFNVFEKGELIAEITLPIPGEHIVLNSLAAIAVAREFGIKADVIADSLASFTGVGRRLEVVGVEAGVTVINDYGHHPTEIKATISAIKQGWPDSKGKLHVVFQPHRYSRTKSCFVDFINSFSGCDNLIMTEIYSAGEDAIEGVTGKSLLDGTQHDSKRFVENPEDVLPELLSEVQAGDFVLCLGAGSIGSLPIFLIEALKSISVKEAI
ncbi:MAG: UDP-N-acetylmuramate--L-alanine ligase [Bdellovibrionota bacterium]